ncbi:MAG: ATP-binding protein [Cyanobacteria bacterium P01_E01_bin.6]
MFTDSMMTVAAVDRLVHHAVLLEIKAKSYRQKAAAQRSTDSQSA